MLVYRVQNHCAQGPFQGGYMYTEEFYYDYTIDVDEELTALKLASCELPTPMSDIPDCPDMHNEYVCGTNSIELLHKWFPPRVLEDLSDNGYEVVIIDVPDDEVYVGTYQVVFPIAYAKEIV